MTCKEERGMQLDALKDGLSPVLYHCAILNCAFIAERQNTYTFETMAEALEKRTELLRSGFYPAFVRCWATVDF